MIKHLRNTFPFNMEKDSICSICLSADCDNLTLWLRKGGKEPKKYFLKNSSEIEHYTGDNKRFPEAGNSNYKGRYGRIGDLISFAKSGKVVDIVNLKEEALRYILGVDFCLGFNRFSTVNDDQVFSEAGGGHSIQYKAMSLGLFEAAVNDTRALNSPDEKVKTSIWGKKSYMAGR